MNRCQQAIAHIRSLLEPPVKFVSGAKIYQSDNPKKQEILHFTMSAVSCFESGGYPVHGEPIDLEGKLEEYRQYLDTCADDPEIQDYLELLSAVQELLVSCR